jgi:hypothetical protein
MKAFLGKLISTFILMTSFAASAATVTFNYTGNQLYGTGGTTTQPGDIVTASLTFDAEFAVYGKPALSDVITWSISTPKFTLNQDNGYLTENWPSAPFIIYEGKMLNWQFGARSDDYPYQGVGLNNNVSPGPRDGVSVTPGYSANSWIEGEWTVVSDVPLPAGSWLFVSALLTLVARSKRKVQAA